MTNDHDYQEQGLFTIEHEGLCYHIPRYCPHRAGRLDHGNINIVAKTVSCPLHHSVFSLDTGEQISGPLCSTLEISMSKITNNLKNPTEKTL